MTGERTVIYLDNISLIEKHFRNLRECHNFANRELSDEDVKKLEEIILPAVEKEYELLEQLGVSREFSAVLFVFGKDALIDTVRDV